MRLAIKNLAKKVHSVISFIIMFSITTNIHTCTKEMITSTSIKRVSAKPLTANFEGE